MSPAPSPIRQRTVRAALEEGVARIAGDTPRLDAELLLANTLGCSRTWLLAHATDVLPDGAYADYASSLARRAAGEPVAYILGRAAFWSLDLEVSPATLVPRPETETLVEQVLALFDARPIRVLDLGTGSGAIALALARERPTWDVIGVDVDAAAVEIASRNAVRNRIANARFVEGNWFAPVTGSQFELIVSNPPYIRADDPCLLGVGLRFEPRVALASGADGFDALRTVVGGAPRHLLPGGTLACEHGAEQGAELRSLFARVGFNAARSVRDLAGHERVTLGRLPTPAPGSAPEESRHG